MYSKTLSRRGFFKATSGALLGIGAPLLQPGDPDDPEWPFIQPNPVRLDLLGRITETSTIRATPGLNQPVVTFIAPETVIPLFEEIRFKGANPNNDLWWRVDGGYLYSSWVQPMKPYKMPEIVTEIDGEFGFWAEVIAPYTWARQEPSGALLPDDQESVYHYASVYRVIGIEEDAAGHPWYKVHDDRPPEKPVYVLARHMRRISEDAFKPINPGASDKHIVVTLAAQRIDCYEGSRLVFSTLTSSGGDGFGTPVGEHYMALKQPSRHMFGEENLADPNYFDLPGVPWNIFFTTLGHAIHGTYWHSDYGRPRSHGCLNVSPEAANWIYRWVEPAAPYDSDFTPGSRATGTPVVVIES